MKGPSRLREHGRWRRAIPGILVFTLLLTPGVGGSQPPSAHACVSISARDVPALLVGRTTYLGVDITNNCPHDLPDSRGAANVYAGAWFSDAAPSAFGAFESSERLASLESRQSTRISLPVTPNRPGNQYLSLGVWQASRAASGNGPISDIAVSRVTISFAQPIDRYKPLVAHAILGLHFGLFALALIALGLGRRDE